MFINEKKQPPPYDQTVWVWIDYNKAGVRIKGWHLGKRISFGMIDDYKTVNTSTFEVSTFEREYVKIWSPYLGLTENPPILDDLPGID